MTYRLTEDQCIALAADVLLNIRDEMQAAGVTLD
jgi:hypothetical protein